MTHAEIARVVDIWVEQSSDLGAHDFIRYVQIFENKGALMGCSNPHPHGQIWATESLPVEPEKEHRCQREYFNRHHRTMIEDYMTAELERAERIVCRNDTWAAVVPFWAKWPFETLLAPLRPVQSMAALDEAERDGLADLLRRVTVRYDNLFRVSFPYTMGVHQAPTDGLDHPHWHLHVHFYPPLLRSATVQKFMVGFEMLATPQRDITPEDAAEQLRSLSEVHYRAGSAPAEEAGA
jgi:UDPglucose--hexose-1-phosphate uridylyltransferase